MIDARQQSGTAYPIQFYLVLSSDHVTPATGKTVTVTLSKNGGAFGAASGAVSELANGWYSLAGNATDRNTLGTLAIRGTAASCDDVAKTITIVPYDPMAKIDSNVTHWIGTAAATPTVAGVPEVDITYVGGQAATATGAINFDALNSLVRHLAGSTAKQLSTSGSVPEWFNLEKAALRIRYGWCNALWVGDSISSAESNPRVFYGILRTWDVRIIGLHVPASAQVPTEGWNSFFNGGTGFTEATGVVPSASSNGVTNNTCLLMSTASPAGNVATNTPFFDCYLDSLGLYNLNGNAPKQFSNGDWTASQRLKAAILYAKHPTSGTNLSTAYISTQRGSETVTSTVSDLSAATAGHSSIAFDFPTPTATQYTTTRTFWSTGAEAEAGKVFANTGHLLYVEGATTGYSHAACAVGGWSATDHLSSLNSGGDATYYSSDGKYTQAQLVTTLGLLRYPNTFFINIGTNVGADEDGTTIAPYKANVLKIINRYRVACTSAGITDPLFVLIAPWQTSTDGVDGATTRTYRDAQANALYELAVAAPTDVAFINLHGIIKRKLGAYSIWQGTYLADWTHQNTSGAILFGQYLWDAICEAAAASAVSTLAMRQSRKLDLDASATPATAVTGSLLDRVANKDSSKTYSAATDSLEALSDGSVGGSGARTVTITVNDGSTAINAAIVRMTLASETYTATTNSSGVATFNVDDGTWTVGITKAGYTYAGTTIVVDGTETATYSMTAIVITPASDPSQTTAYLTTRDGGGTVLGNVTIAFKLVSGPGDAGHSYDAAGFTATSHATTGLLQVTLLREANYIGIRGDGTEIPFITADASTYQLPELLGFDAD